MRYNEAYFYNTMELNDLYSLVRGSAGICTDSRNIKKGEIFFALRGPNHDGNKYATAAIMSGAAAAVVDEPSLKSEKMLVVNNVLDTLTDLAAMHRKVMNVPVIAVTGSNGKTTTKELITSVLSKKSRVHSTPGNLNNHIGVPLAVLSAPADAGFMVVEMGANHKGEIASLCEVAMPTHGIITNIGKAHLEGFGSFKDVIAAKAELYHWLRKAGGIVIFNEKSSTLKELIHTIVHKAVPYSDPAGTDLIVNAVENDDICLNLTADFEGHHYAFTTNMFGSYNLDNVRAAMAVGVFFGVPIDDIVNAISSYQPANNRSQVMITEYNTLICDSYNANPSSMMKAITSFSEMRAEKKMMILADMLELGAESTAEHARIIEVLDGLESIEAHLVGPLFRSVTKSKKITSFTGADELREWLIKIKPRGYSILVKGSRGMMLEKIYDVL